MPCLELVEIAPPKQQIMNSRSFGRSLDCIEELPEAVATYVGHAAEKLRQHGSVSGAVYVLVQTNAFKANERQYNAGLTVPLLDPSDDTRVLIQAALRGAEDHTQGRLSIRKGRGHADAFVRKGYPASITIQ